MDTKITSKVEFPLNDFDLSKFVYYSEDPGVYKNDIIMENILVKP